LCCEFPSDTTAVNYLSTKVLASISDPDIGATSKCVILGPPVGDIKLQFNFIFTMETEEDDEEEEEELVRRR
jgi:alpha-ketoglutarate-dependent taurine dioxygenase